MRLARGIGMTSSGAIIVGTEFSPMCEVAIGAAVRAAEQTGAKRLHLAHVLNPARLTVTPLLPDLMPPDLLRTLADEAERDAKERILALRVAAPPGIEVTREVRIGQPVQELVRVAESFNASLIVAATHGRSALGRIFLGSVTNNLVRTADRPVLVVGAERPGTKPIRRVVAAVDLSPVSRAVLLHAVRMLGSKGELDVLSLVTAPVMNLEPPAPWPNATIEEYAGRIKARIEELLSELSLPPAIKVQIDVHFASPASAIVAHAKRKDADLIALGTSGHSLVQRAVLGSTATRVLSEADAPVLIIPHGSEGAGAPTRANGGHRT
jgi:nucleotide-binding universal stress UspA family protein